MRTQRVKKRNRIHFKRCSSETKSTYLLFLSINNKRALNLKPFTFQTLFGQKENYSVSLRLFGLCLNEYLYNGIRTQKISSKTKLKIIV